MKSVPSHLRCIALAATLAFASVAALAADAVPFAKVGDVVLTQQDFDAAFAQAARSKFYHGKPPEAAVDTASDPVPGGASSNVAIAAVRPASSIRTRCFSPTYGPPPVIEIT